MDDAKDEPPMWWLDGHNVYNDDYGSLVAECASGEIAFAMVEAANADPEFRRRIRDAK